MNPALEHLVGPDPWKIVRELHALETAIRAVRVEIELSQRGKPISALVDAVAAEFNVPSDAIRGRGRSARVAEARQVAMVLARDLFAASASEVGRMFGRDHGTVLWAAKAVANAMDTCPATARRVNALRHRLSALAPQPDLPLTPAIPNQLAA